MPARKTEQFGRNHVLNSQIGRALSHPARLRIIEILKTEIIAKNTDLLKILKLSQPSVSNHIKKLQEADLIDLTFALTILSLFHFVKMRSLGLRNSWTGCLGMLRKSL